MVLVVEDEQRDRAVLARLLVDAGYRVDLARTGAEALLKIQAGHFEAVALDLLLPDMSGLEVLQAIRRGNKTPELPVLVVTVLENNSAISSFSVHDVLTKPVNGPAMLASLERAGIMGHAPGYVLVVDDDLRSLELMRATLDELGYTAICEQETDSALGVIRRCPPVAVILDLMMPSMTGFEFLERVQEQSANREVPVIIWTAKDLSPSEQQQLRQKAKAVIHKHGVTGGLLDQLRGALSRPHSVRAEA
jgi:CheY-like chemotaxis protein